MTATLQEDDTLVGTVNWQWARSSTADGTFSNISGANSESYTTSDADAGNFLRATASYEDESGPTQSASAVTSDRVAIDSYDANSDGVINADEVLTAVADYFADRISADRVLGVVALYFRAIASN